MQNDAIRAASNPDAVDDGVTCAARLTGLRVIRTNGMKDVYVV
jgi:hypothetical protein